MRNRRPCFVWRFYSGQNSTYLTTTATSDKDAVAEASRLATINGLKHIRIVYVHEGVSRD
ncbi:hypothetical protein DCN33_005210 [Salmonella enterica subsp. diarizonae serovar 48:i:z]|nr:hypothetical protein [Salmonella enterica subsp. diarizonae serovar 48:i:z]EDN5753334.1 hypothetical protein [Salmonella enterica subsp. diarizonae serovar 48:i:z]